jgi:hypothetical protein
MILNDGGDLVLMGYKSEDMGVVVHTLNGGCTEVLGGVITLGHTGDAAFLVEDAQLRIATASQGWLSDAYHITAIRQIVNGRKYELQSNELPFRGFDKSRGPQSVIPLFRGLH